MISDQVMGGQSSGKLSWSESAEAVPCLHLNGVVSTANNGGFIQMSHELTRSEQMIASNSSGIRLVVRGNGQTYNVHLRTLNLWLPWQSYRASFNTDKEWQEVMISFEQFEAYKTSKKLDLNKIRRIGIVAIGRDFDADICVAEIGFTSNI